MSEKNKVVKRNRNASHGLTKVIERGRLYFVYRPKISCDDHVSNIDDVQVVSILRVFVIYVIASNCIYIYMVYEYFYTPKISQIIVGPN